MHVQRMIKHYWEDVLVVVFLLVALLWRIPYLSLGIDYTDTSFYLAGYKAAFAAGGLSDVGIFMTNILGGIIYKLLPSHHLLAYRILDWIVYGVIFLMTYLTFRNLVPKSVLAAIILVESLIIKRFPMTLSYNTFTAFFLMSSTCLMYIGISKKKMNAIFFSGVSTGLGIFFRIPNLVHIGIFVAPLWYYLFCEKNTDLLKFSLTRFFIGLAAGLSLTFFIITITVGFKVFMQSVSTYASTFFDDGGYSLPYFINILFRQIRTIVDRLSTGKPMNVLYYTQMFGFATFILSIPAAVLTRKKHPIHSLVFTLTAIVCFALSVGSNTVLNILSTLFAPAMIAMALFVKQVYYLFPMDKSKPKLRVFLHVTGIILLLYSASYTFDVLKDNNYRDGVTTELVQSTKAPELAGMKTTISRAKSLDTAYRLLNLPEYQDNELIVFGSFPLGFVIAPNARFFEPHWGAWPDLSQVPMKNITNTIEQKTAEGILPNIMVSFLEINDVPTRTTFRGEKKVEAVRSFAQEHDYNLLHVDNNFEYYVPNNAITNNP